MIEMTGNNHAPYGNFKLENLEFDTPFSVPLADLQPGPQRYESSNIWIWWMLINDDWSKGHRL